MGRASNRKKQQRAGKASTRATDARRFRVVVCSYPDNSLEPAAELLKAAVIYGDEVLLHSPTAMLLASLASLAHLPVGDLIRFMRDVAPIVQGGADFAEGIAQLDDQLGAAGTQAAFQLLVDPGSPMRDLLSALDPGAASQLTEHTRQLSDVRLQLDRAIEEQLAGAGVRSIMPAIDAGLLRLVPIETTEDFFDGYLSALWSVLRDPAYFPLFDDRIAELVVAAVREGALTPSAGMRSRGQQAGAARGFLARLPTFPLASMDEIVDIRAELERPLIRFRAEMVNVARDLGVETFDPGFEDAAGQAWTSKVRPALLELEELVEEKRFRRQFGVKLPGSGALGGAGGLLTGIITHAPLVGAGVAVGAAGAAAVASVVTDRARLEREIRRRPYYLLHRTEKLLSD